MNRIVSFGCLAIGLFCSRSALAIDAYDSFAHPGDVYDATTGYSADGGFYGPTFTPRISACRFTSLASGELAVIRIALHSDNSPAQPGFEQVDVRLHAADASGNIGAIIAAFTRGGLPPSSALLNPPETITSFDPAVVLTAGNRYWIVVAPGDSTTKARWNWSVISTGAADRFATSTNGGASYIYIDGQPVGAMRIELIPEPATLTALVIGITGLALGSKRRR